MSSPKENIVTNQTTKRRKIEIKEVEQTDRRNVTFSKRKLGLFNKLTELSILCQVDTALIITSQNGKFYSCGYPNVDAVLNRYIKRESPKHIDHARKKKEQEMIKTLRLEYEATQDQLKEEKKSLQVITETQKSGLSFLPWWNLPIEGMNLENLEQFKNSLERLRSSLVAAFQGKQLNAVPSMSSSSSSYAIGQSVTSFINIDYPPQKTIMVEPIRTMNGNSSNSLMVPPIPCPIFSPRQSAMIPPMAHSTSEFANKSMLPQNFNGNQIQEYYKNGVDTNSLPISDFTHYC